MTEELLAQGNNLKSRINQVEKLLESIDLTDPSGNYPSERISPIMIQAGMAQTIQFDVVNVVDCKPTEVQLLDAKIHKMIVEILKDYKQKLEKMFKDLS